MPAGLKIFFRMVIALLEDGKVAASHRNGRPYAPD
jgi:hypothetical protein